jgi:hypothetical protein
MVAATVTVRQQDYQRSWVQLRSVRAWLHTVRHWSLHLLLAVSLIEPLGCLLHCSPLVATTALPVSSHSLNQHSSHAYPIGGETAAHPGVASQSAPVSPVGSTGSVDVLCAAHDAASTPFDAPAPIDMLSLHVHLIALALGVAVSVGLAWQNAPPLPTHPPPQWLPPQLLRPPKIRIFGSHSLTA